VVIASQDYFNHETLFQPDTITHLTLKHGLKSQNQYWC